MEMFEEFDAEDWKEAAMEGLGINQAIEDVSADLLEKFGQEHPETMKEILAERFSATKEFVSAEGKIDYQALAEKLSLDEKFSLIFATLFSDFFGEKVMGQIMESTDALKTKTIPWNVAVEQIISAKIGGIPLASKTNIVWQDKGNPIIKLKQLWGLGKLAMQEGEDEERQLGVIPGSTIVLERGNGDSYVSKLSQIRRTLKVMEPPVILKTMQANQFFEHEAEDPNNPENTISKPVPKPGSNEVFVVFAQGDGLPRNEDDGLVNMNVMQGYTNLYEQGKVQWFTPDIVAGVRVMQGATVDNALGAVGIDNPAPYLKQDLKDLAKLVKGEKPKSEEDTKEDDVLEDESELSDKAIT
jgi:hypothetical protein